MWASNSNPHTLNLDSDGLAAENSTIMERDQCIIVSVEKDKIAWAIGRVCPCIYFMYLENLISNNSDKISFCILKPELPFAESPHTNNDSVTLSNSSIVDANGESGREIRRPIYYDKSISLPMIVSRCNRSAENRLSVNDEGRGID